MPTCLSRSWERLDRSNGFASPPIGLEILALLQIVGCGSEAGLMENERTLKKQTSYRNIQKPCNFETIRKVEIFFVLSVLSGVDERGCLASDEKTSSLMSSLSLQKGRWP